MHLILFNTDPVTLSACEQVIHMNSASYTAWEWRWRCLDAAGCAPEALAAEARLLADLAAASPKNYQLWNHRRRLALQRGAAHAPEVRRLRGQGTCSCQCPQLLQTLWHHSLQPAYAA